MDKLTIFIGVTASAVVLQMLILLAMFVTMRKLGARMQALADKVEETTTQVQTRVLPVIDNAKAIQQDVKSFLDTARPKIETIIDNASRISSTTRTTVERFDATANDAIDRVRLPGDSWRRDADAHHGSGGRDLREGSTHSYVAGAPGFRNHAGDQHGRWSLFQHPTPSPQRRTIG